MQSRESRFSLRFESGAREGETIPLSEGSLTLGRRPGNQVVVADGSVSGKHAEIRIESGSATITDLGSTNGTRVGGDKLTGDARLAHGDSIHLGSVQLVFLDTSVAGSDALAPDAAPAPAPAASAGSGEALGRISADKVESSSKRSLVGLVVLLVVVGAGVAAWRFLPGSSTTEKRVTVPVVAGNLVEAGSFESDDPAHAWEDAEAAPQAFFRDATFAETGSVGFGVLLADGEWAFARSPQFELRARRTVEVRATLTAEDGATARFGIELSSAEDEATPFLVWSKGVEAGTEEIELTFDTLPGYDRAELVVAARSKGEGAASVDDVSAVLAEGTTGAAASFGDAYEAHVFGPSSATAALVRSGSVIFPGISHGAWSEAGLAGHAGGSWTAKSLPNGLSFSSAGASADAVLRLDIDAQSTAPSNGGGDAGDAGWISVIGPDGYQSLATEFDVPRATSLLVGKGIQLVRIGFAEPIRIQGAVRAGLLRVRAHTKGRSALEVQLTFAEERSQALLLQSQGREAETKEEHGRALATWSELLDKYPFDSELIVEAESARARITQLGLERVDEVRREMERARFFALPDLYRLSLDRATSIAQNFAGSEVEAEARKLEAEIAAELAALGTDSHEDLDRLAEVLSAIGDDADSLSSHIRSYLESKGHDPAEKRPEDD